jgi:hypothetical protein
MSTREVKSASKPISLNEDDVAFLIAILRDPARPQPLTTQDLMDALRGRTGK